MSSDCSRRIDNRHVLGGIILCFVLVIVVLLFSHPRQPDTGTAVIPEDLDQLYEYYSDLTSSGADQSVSTRVKQEYVDRCVRGGLECISDQYHKHGQDNLLSSIVEKYVLPEIDDMSFDEHYSIVNYYLGTPFQQRMIGPLGEKAIQSGPLEISKYYSLGVDDDFDLIVEYDVMEVLFSLPIAEVRLLLPYYKGTRFQDEIETEFFSMVQSELNGAVYTFSSGVLDETIQDSSITSDLSKVYYALYGKYFSKVKNTVLKREKTFRDDFMKIWGKEFQTDKYIEQFSDSFDRNLALYKKTCDKILSDLGYDEGYQIPISNETILRLTPSDSLVRTMNTKELLSVAKDIGLGVVDLATVSVTGGLGVLIFAGQMAADFAVEQKLGTEEEFINGQADLIYIQVINVISQITDQFSKENDNILNRIETDFDLFKYL